MIRRIGSSLLLSLLLLPVSLVAEQPGLAELSDGLDIDRSKPPRVLRDNRARLMIYHQGQAASALPHWWHHPELLIKVTKVAQHGPLGQMVIQRQDVETPLSMLLLTPRGPIIQEEEPLLGIDR
ncbi:hypothetical protein [Bremerella alba]|uniref:Uncharacterized protein n=1 Tax=Bremerella alba TaxID=980252 RepID=A0A7V8V9K2_9BACT|nr:hypothetical protein [Bremerella alba]MBA2117462.1 hypothetical protein [Bremerella alba]